MLTSHVDLIPTMLGLAGINIKEVQDKLKIDHTEVRPLVGRNLSSLILRNGIPKDAGDPIYFMTDDDPTKGLDQENFLGWSIIPLFSQIILKLLSLSLKQKMEKKLGNILVTLIIHSFGQILVKKIL